MKGRIKMIVTPKTVRTLKTVMSVIVVAMMIFSLAINAFAAGDDTAATIESGIKTGMEQIYKIITSVVIPVAVVVVAFCAFKIFTGGEKGMEQAKKTLLITVVAIAIVYLAPFLVTQVSGWFKQNSTGNVFK